MTARNAVATAGMFPSHADLGGVKNLSDWEAWLGRKVASIDANTGGTSWDNFTGSSFGNFVKPGAFQTRPDVTMWITIGLNVIGSMPYTSGSGYPANQVAVGLQSVARGDQDERYRLVAKRLVDAGHEDAYLRIGHEQDGFYPWSARNGNHVHYVPAYRHIAEVMKGVSSKFRTVFEVDSGGTSWNPHAPNPAAPGKTFWEAAYPGDDWVNVCSQNSYASNWPKAGKPNAIATQKKAVLHGKGFAIGEWGVHAKDTTAPFGGDSPAYIQEMYDLLSSFPDSGPGALLHHGYFHAFKDCWLTVANAPLSRVKYKELFDVIPSGGGGTTPPIDPCAGLKVENERLEHELAAAKTDLDEANAKIHAAITVLS